MSSLHEMAPDLSGGGGVTGLVPTTGEQALIQQAFDLERGIISDLKDMHTLWGRLAEKLYVFVEERAWKLRSCDSLEEWLAGPDIELGRTQVLRLVRVYRSLVVEHRVPLEDLEGLSLSKADVVLPAIRAGRKSTDEALSDARSMTRADLVVEYDGDPTGFDAEQEPAFCECSTCGKVHRPKGTQA